MVYCLFHSLMYHFNVKVRIMKKSIIILSLCYLFLLGGCDLASQNYEEFLKPPAQQVELDETYTNSQNGFSFKYPSSWENSPAPGTVISLLGFTDNGAITFNVVVQQFDPGMMKIPQSSFESELKKIFSNMEFLDFKKGKFHGHPAVFMYYKCQTEDKIPVEVKQYVFNTPNKKNIVLSMGCVPNPITEDDQNLFDCILDSFQCE